MHFERVSALGVCDATGALVANVSASDLRGLTPERLDSLASDVRDFLEDARGAGEREHPATCLATETVRDVVERMVARRVHHVYVCDAERRPVAMITPNDVLGVLADVLVEG